MNLGIINDHEIILSPNLENRTHLSPRHIGLETWEIETIKVIIGVECWFLVCLLIAWGITSCIPKVKRPKKPCKILSV